MSLQLRLVTAAAALSVGLAGTIGLRYLDVDGTAQAAKPKVGGFPLPDRISELLERRNNEILDGKLNVAEKAQALLNALETYREDVARFSPKYLAWRIEAPYVRARTGRWIPRPAEVDRLGHEAKIQAAADEWLIARDWLSAEIDRIDARYYQDLLPLFDLERSKPGPLPIPNADCDPTLAEATAAADELQSELRAINDTHRASFGFSIITP